MTVPNNTPSFFACPTCNRALDDAAHSADQQHPVTCCGHIFVFGIEEDGCVRSWRTAPVDKNSDRHLFCQRCDQIKYAVHLMHQKLSAPVGSTGVFRCDACGARVLWKTFDMERLLRELRDAQ